MLFNAHPQYASLKTEIIAATKATESQVDAAATKLTFQQILNLIFQFGAQFGPSLFAAISTIITDVKNGTIENPIVVEGLVQLYGPSVIALATAIAGIFGLQIPVIPGLPTPPAGTIFKAAPFAISH